MSCTLTPTQRAELEALRAQYVEYRDAALVELAAAQTAINEYRFDSGDGSQQAKRIKLKDLRETIDWYETKIAEIDSRLSGECGVVKMRLRRR